MANAIVHEVANWRLICLLDQYRRVVHLHFLDRYPLHASIRLLFESNECQNLLHLIKTLSVVQPPLLKSKDFLRVAPAMQTWVGHPIKSF